MRTVLFALLLVGAPAALAHRGGLNACGCHFNRKTGECHCHRPQACGCECEPPGCASKLGVETLGVDRGAPETPGPVPVAPDPVMPYPDQTPESVDEEGLEQVVEGMIPGPRRYERAAA